MARLFNKDKVIDALGLRSSGSKGWMSSRSCSCPDCEKWDKFGLNLNSDFGAVHCFKCDHSSSLVTYLRKLGRTDLLTFERGINTGSKLEWGEDEEKENLKELKEVKKPFGFKRVYYDDYLDSRGFLPIQYNLFYTGTSTDKRLTNYIVFLIHQDGKVVGWVARSKRSKDWHEKNLRAHKDSNGEVSLVLRYRNSDGTDFDRILFGIDEVTKETKRVYLVEGLFDKSNTDVKLGLYDKKFEKCCCTFGNKVSDHQIQMLVDKGIKEVVLMYDYGTIKQSKDYGMKLTRYFKVSVTEFFDKDIDPGNASQKYFREKIFNLRDIYYFYNLRLNEFRLR